MKEQREENIQILLWEVYQLNGSLNLLELKAGSVRIGKRGSDYFVYHSGAGPLEYSDLAKLI
jgi:hypothetical protein